jgi:uncharacterized membrane protein YfcA
MHIRLNHERESSTSLPSAISSRFRYIVSHFFSRFLYRLLFLLLLGITVFWYGSRGYAPLALLFPVAIGVLVGAAIGAAWLKRVKGRVRGNIYFAEPLPKAIWWVIGSVFIVAAALLPLLVSIPGRVLIFVGAPASIGLAVGATVAMIWVLRFEKEHGPLYVQDSRNPR